MVTGKKSHHGLAGLGFYWLMAQKTRDSVGPSLVVSKSMLPMTHSSSTTRGQAKAYLDAHALPSTNILGHKLLPLPHPPSTKSHRSIREPAAVELPWFLMRCRSSPSPAMPPPSWSPCGAAPSPASPTPPPLTSAPKQIRHAVQPDTQRRVGGWQRPGTRRRGGGGG
jgi:hypothetical protein